MTNIIRCENEELLVPNIVIIPFIEGDGIGTDITPAMKKVVNSAVKKTYDGKKKIIWETFNMCVHIS